MLNTNILGKIFAEAVIHTSKNQQADKLLEAIGRSFGHVVIACVQPKAMTTPQPSTSNESPDVPKIDQYVKSSNEQTYVIHDIYDAAGQELVVRNNVASSLEGVNEKSLKTSLAFNKLVDEGSIVYCSKSDAIALDEKNKELSEWGNKGAPVYRTGPETPLVSIESVDFNGSPIKTDKLRTVAQQVNIINEDAIDCMKNDPSAEKDREFIATFANPISLQEALDIASVRSIKDNKSPIEIAVLDSVPSILKEPTVDFIAPKNVQKPKASKTSKTKGSSRSRRNGKATKK